MDRLAAWNARKPVIAIMGEFSAGKSTLLNMLIGQTILPTQVTATKLPPVWLRHGSDAPYRVDRDNQRHPVDINDLAAVPLKDTRYIRIFCDAEVLESCDLLDTPGISDPNIPMKMWLRTIGYANAVLWCSHAAQAWRESERSAWESLPERLRRHSLLLVTRADKITSDIDRMKIDTRLRRETENLFGGRLFISLSDGLRALQGEGDAGLWTSSGAENFVDLLASSIAAINDDRGMAIRRYRAEPASVGRVTPRRVRPASMADHAATVDEQRQAGGAEVVPLRTMRVVATNDGRLEQGSSSVRPALHEVISDHQREAVLVLDNPVDHHPTTIEAHVEDLNTATDLPEVDNQTEERLVEQAEALDPIAEETASDTTVDSVSLDNVAFEVPHDQGATEQVVAIEANEADGADQVEELTFAAVDIDTLDAVTKSMQADLMEAAQQSALPPAAEIVTAMDDFAADAPTLAPETAADTPDEAAADTTVGAQPDGSAAVDVLDMADEPSLTDGFLDASVEMASEITSELATGPQDDGATIAGLAFEEVAHDDLGPQDDEIDTQAILARLETLYAGPDVGEPAAPEPIHEPVADYVATETVEAPAPEVVVQPSQAVAATGTATALWQGVLAQRRVETVEDVLAAMTDFVAALDRSGFNLDQQADRAPVDATETAAERQLSVQLRRLKMNRRRRA
jgi:hypothetical protein